MAKARPSAPRQDPRHRALASAIFGGFLLAAVLAIFFAAPERLPAYKQPIVPILAALLCGSLAFFFTGSIGVQFSWLKATGSIGVVVLVLVVWKQLVPPPPGLLHVPVVVVDTSGRLVSDAEVRSSIPGVWKRAGNSWELDLPAAALPADRMLILDATKPATFLSGHGTVRLREEDPELSVSITLRRDESATISGQVQDAAGFALAGVRVNLAGHEGEGVETSAFGGFELPAHAAPGEAVRLHAEKAGYAPVEQEDLGGNHEVLLRLARR
jgi:hypothetical protein